MPATVLPLINDSIERAPGSIAIRAADGVLTYAELSAQADALAARLRDAGVRPGELVGQCTERSAALVVAALGIVRAGAAYVAIDPAYPDERIRWMLDDSGATAVVTDAATAARLDAQSRCRVVVGADAAPSPVDRGTPGPSMPQAGPTDLAYVVYTSGSTGRPKGVMVEHAGLANLVQWHRSAFALDAARPLHPDRQPRLRRRGVGDLARPGGGRRHPRRARAPAPRSACAARLARQRGITVVFLPTALAEPVIGLRWPATARLRYLLTGGDALTRRPAPGLGSRWSTTTGSARPRSSPRPGRCRQTARGAPSIGRPIAGIVAEIVDEELDPGGPRQARRAGDRRGGGRPRLPQPARAHRRPFRHAVRGGRRYRTGDLVRAPADGEIEFLGRLDDQVRIRGLPGRAGRGRAALDSHPAIASSVAAGTEAAGAERQLVAYVVAAAEPPAGPASCARSSARRLPEYMVPRAMCGSTSCRSRRTASSTATRCPRRGDGPARGPPASRRPRRSRRPSPTSWRSCSRSTRSASMRTSSSSVATRCSPPSSSSGSRLFGVEIGLRYLFDHPTPWEIAAEAQRQMVRPTACPMGWPRDR